ncbi:MAG: M23 family metallopeptidase [Planctomycetaceae bacterium]
MPSTGARRRTGRGAGTAALLLLMALLVALAAPAIAQESPSPTASPTESSSPSTEPSPSDTPSSPSPTDPGGGMTLPPPGGSGGSGGSGSGTGPGGATGGGVTFTMPGPRRHAHPGEKDWRGWAPDPHWGTYNTAPLDALAIRRRHQGWSEAKIARRIYAPFIVEGPADWSDSWGAPRWDGYYHPHHGQDVLCRYGAPVLAVEDGTIAYGYDSLGGNAAYLQRGDGSFWYYAHLSRYVANLKTGMHVTKGEVIGHCGATGDASVPHVHFCFFDVNHDAVDPMSSLVRWLREAEERAGVKRSVPNPDAKAPVPVPHARTPHARPTGTVVGSLSTGPPLGAPALTPVRDIPSRTVGTAAGLVLLALSLTWAGRRTSRGGEVGSRR